MSKSEKRKKYRVRKGLKQYPDTSGKPGPWGVLPYGQDAPRMRPILSKVAGYTEPALSKLKFWESLF
jgi:hypothetical protein